MNERSTPRAAPSFSEVYEVNAARVYGFIGYRVSSRAEAEDLTQLVFEKALRAWGRFDDRISSPSTWLLSIAKNVLVDHFRRRRESLIGEEAIVRIIDASPDHPGVGLPADLEEAMSALTPREQTVLALRFGGDMSGAEIASMLELSTDNVHQILSRTLRRLRESLEGNSSAGERADAGHAEDGDQAEQGSERHAQQRQ